MRSIRITPTRLEGNAKFIFALSIFAEGFSILFGKYGVYFGWDLIVDQTHNVSYSKP